MVRPDLTTKDVERMGRQEPGSAARYLEERRQELAAEEQKRREDDDKSRWTEAFVAAGGNPVDAQAAYRAYQNEQAAEAARVADREALQTHRRRLSQSL